jgi:hypothetical protein
MEHLPGVNRRTSTLRNPVYRKDSRRESLEDPARLVEDGHAHPRDVA